VRLDAVLIALAVVLAGLGITAIWMRLGIPLRRRALESAALLAIAAGAIAACSHVRGSWDTSESRGNSFPVADERALRQIHQPLRIEVHLAPEDPRRVELERRALSKLRRVLPDTEVTYVSATSIGLFEQTNEGYGEIRYSLGKEKATSRVTTEEGVLEVVFSLAGIQPPKEDDDAAFHGHPLAARPTGAAAVFFGVWPGLIVAAAIVERARRKRR
jgi:hypothetical protein